MKSFMTVKEYAEKNNISVQAVYQRIKNNKLTCKKIGSMHLVEVEPTPEAKEG